MRGYTEISTQEEMDALLTRLAGFHDSMAKELHIVNRGWIDEDRSMIMNHRFDARVLIQSQWRVPGLELLFVGVERLETGDPGEYGGALGSILHQATPVETRRILMVFDESLKITAQRAFFINRPEWTGPQTRMGSEVPSPECIPAATVDRRWRQCSSCADAFEASPEEIYVLCPSCKQLTELRI
jgi:hypothetical protein